MKHRFINKINLDAIHHPGILFPTLLPVHQKIEQKWPWYRFWHKNANVNKIHFGILRLYIIALVIGIIFSVAPPYKLLQAAPSTVDTSTSASATNILNYPSQRKTFYDSTNSKYWAFYNNGSEIEYSYSADGSSWTSSSTIADNTADFSIWQNGTTIYLAYVSGTGQFCSWTPCGKYIKITKGTVSSTSISFSSATTIYTETYGASNVSVAQDTNGKIWVVWDCAGANIGGRRVRSTNANDETVWDASTYWTTSMVVYGPAIVPLASGDMMITYSDSLCCAYDHLAQKYTNATSSWGSGGTIDTTNADRKPSSTVSDSGTSTVHFLYTIDTGNVKYNKYSSGAWGTAITLDSNSGNSSPTISRDTATGNLYAFWIRSNTIYYKKGVSPYAAVNWDASPTALYSTGTNTNANVAFNTTGSKVFLEWTNGSGSPYSIYFDNSISTAASVTRYWIDADGGNWNDTANWSETSGGSGGASVPVAGEIAIFDNAGGTRNGALTIDIAVSVGVLTFDTNYSGTITQGANTITVLNAMTLTGTSLTAGANITNGHLVIASGKILDINGYNLTVTGAVANDGTLKLQGGETTVSLTNDTDSGTVEYYGTAGPYTLKNWTYFNLKINSSGKTFNLPAAITCNGDLTISAGILDSNTYDLSVKGSWTNSDTFTAGTKTVNFTSTTSGKTINPGSSAFYNLTFNGSGGVWSPLTNTVTVTNDLTMTAGTFNNAAGSANVTVNGNVAGSTTISMTTNTFTQNVAANKNFGTTVGANSWSFYNLTFSSSSGTPTITTQTGGTGSITVSQTLTISANTTLNAGNRTWILTGAIASPFSYSGTLTPATSTFRYTNVNASGNVNITTAPYRNLTLTPASAETYDLGGNLSGANAVAGILTLSNTNTTFDPKTYDLTVTGAFSSTAGKFGITGTKPSGVHIFSSTWTSITGATFYLSSNATATVITGNISGVGTLNATSNGSLTVNGTTVNFTSVTYTKGSGTFKFNKGATQTFTPSSSNFGNVQVSTASTVVNLAAALTTDALTIDASTTFDPKTYALTVSTAFSNSGNFGITGTKPSGVHIFSSTWTNASGATFFLSSNATATVITGNIDCDGTLNATSNGSLTANGATIDFTNGTFTKGTGTLLFNKGAAQAFTPSASNFGNVQLSTASTNVTLSAALTLNNLTINASTTLTDSGNYAINAAGNWTNNGGTFTPGSSTVTFNGTGAQAIGGSIATTFNAVTVSNTSAALTVSTNMSASGDLTINASAVLAPAAAVVVSGTGTLTGAGTAQVSRTAATPDFSSQYTITNKTLTNLTVEYTAASAQTVSTVAYGHLKISTTASAVATLAAATTLTGNLTISSGGTLSTGSNYDLNIGGNWTNTGTFTPGTGTVTFNGTASSTITGTTTFNNLVMNTTTDGAKTIIFPTGSANKQVISGTWTLDGAVGKVLTLQSVSPATAWYFQIPSPFTSGDYINVTDSWSADANKITPGANVTDGGNNDGWIFFAPELSFSIDSNTVTFDNLNPGNSYADTKTNTVTTNTNAENGYMVRNYLVQALTSLAYPTETVADFYGTWATPQLWPAGTYGFGYTSSDTNVQGSNRFAGGTKYAGFSYTAPGDVVADSTGPTSGDESYTITYKVAVSTTQVASKYQTTVIYIITATY